MTYDEYKKEFEELVKAPDKVAETALKLLDELKTDMESLDSAKATLAERETKIRDLQDTNTKLFLQLTGSGAQPEEPKTPEDILSTMMENQFKEGKPL